MATYELLFSSSKYRFRIFLRPVELLKLHVAEVAWQQSRLLGTAVAREIPINNTRKRKSISKLERKAMVEDYVNKYRSMNAGKFPKPTTVRNQVGGSYYRVKVIVQEMHCNSNLSASATAVNNSIVGQTAQVMEISDARITTGCQVSDDSIAVVQDYGISAECDLSREEVVDKNICQKMVDLSNTNNNHEKIAEHPSSSERKADLEFGGELDKTSASKGMSDDNRITESQEVLVISSMVENTSSNQNATMDDSELPAKTGHHSVVTDTSEELETVKIDEASAKALGSDEFTRGPTSQNTEDKKLQESSLWGNLKGFANNIINLWRKT